MADTVRIEITVEAIDNTGKVIESIVHSLGQLKTAAGKSQESLGKASDTVSKFDRQADRTRKTLQSWLKQKWQLAIEAKDKVTPLLSTIKSGLSSFVGGAWSITLKAVDFVTKPVQGIINLLKNPVIQAGAILGVTIGVKDTIDTYKDFEETMSHVRAVSGASAKEMERLTAKAKEMGETTKFTASEAGDAFTYMAMAGWDAGEMLDGIEGIMALSAADGLDLATTSDIVTDALTAFKLSAADSAHFADVLAKASSSANTNVAMLGSSFKYVAPVAGAFGYSIEDTAIALAMMANAGVKADMGGTALRGALTSLVSPSKEAASVMAKYGLSMEGAKGEAKPLIDVIEMLRSKFNTLNVSLFDGEGELKDYETILAEASQAAGDTSASVEMLSDLSTLFSARALPGMLALIQSGTEDFYELSDAIYHAEGTAGKMSDIMMDNLAGSMKILQSAAEGVKLAVGERVAPYVRSFAEWLTGMMPTIKSALLDGIDWIEDKLTELQAKLTEVMGSVDFQNADFFGKMGKLWDSLIAAPFSDWWSSKGRRIFTGMAQDIGAWLGGGLKAGILMLLGVDVSDAEQDGMSIGRSFAEGFASGFKIDNLGEKLTGALSGLVSSAGKFLPGGAAPGLGSLASAVVLSKLASPVFALGRGVTALGRAATTPTGADKTSLAQWVLGSGATGRGVLGLGAKAATAMGAGNPLIGASLSANAMSAVGLGSIAGGAIGGLTLLRGIGDLYTGFTSEDQEKAAAYKKAGAIEVGGTLAGAGAGAALGATIGSAFFGVGAVPGALIGAGIGGVASWMGGNKAKKEYEERARAAQEAAEMEAAAHEILSAKAEFTGRSIENVTFKSRELTESFRDSEVSAEKFGMMFREAVNEKTVSAFGDITLTLQEIRDMATSIVFDKAISGVEKFRNTMDNAGRAFSSVQSDVASLEKLNWKASLGIDFSSDDISHYRSQVDSYIRDATNYLSEKHYEGTIALKLLTNGEADLSGLDAAYGSLKEELAAKNKELSAKVEIALEDGVIQLDELEEITNLQNQISEIMNRVSKAEESARLETLQIKYGGANLDAASFRQLQSELAAEVQSMTDSYSDALTVSLTNLHLQFPENVDEWTQEDFAAFETAKAKLVEEFQQRMREITLRVEDFQLDTIAGAFNVDFSGVWPELAGSVEDISGRLKQLMDTALEIEPKPMNWTQEQISQWFGLDGMGAEAQAAIGEMLRSVAETLPNVTEILDKVGDMDLSDTLDSAADAIASADASAVTVALENKVEEGITAAEYSGIAELVSNPVNEQLANVEVSEGAAALAENTAGAVTDAMGSMDLSGANEALTTVMSGSFTESADAMDYSEGTGILSTNTTASITETMSGLDLSGATEALRQILGAAIAAGISGTDMSAAIAALAALRQRVETQAQSTLGAQMTVQVPVSLTYNYNVTNPTPPKPAVTTQTMTASVGARANGGFTTGAELSWIGEDGPEAIIPLGAKRRGRGLELYKQVGEILGIARNAEGGVYGYGNSPVTGSSVYESNIYQTGDRITNAGASNQFTDIAVFSIAPDVRNTSLASVVNSPIYGGSSYQGGDSHHSMEYHVSPSFSNTSNSAPHIQSGNRHQSMDYHIFPSFSSVYHSGTDIWGGDSTVVSAAYNTGGNQATSVNSFRWNENRNLKTAFSLFPSASSVYNAESNRYHADYYGGSQIRNVENFSPMPEKRIFPPMANVFHEGPQVSRSNSHTDISAVYGIHGGPVTNISKNVSRDSWAENTSMFSPLSMYNSRQSVANNYGGPSWTDAGAAYNVRNSRVSSLNSTGLFYAKAETAYDGREYPLSVFNSNAETSRNFMSGPTSVYHSGITENSFAETTQAGTGSAYSVNPLFRFPDTATAYALPEKEKAVPESIWRVNDDMAPDDQEQLETGFRPSPIQREETGTQGGSSSGASVAGTPVTIHVSMEPQFNIEGGGGKSEEEIVGIIRRHLREMTDEIGGDLAERLIPVFQNMPMRG